MAPEDMDGVAKRIKLSLMGFAALCLAISGLALVGPVEKPAQIFPLFPLFATPTPVNISNTSSESAEPLIGVDSSGATYVVWLEGGSLLYFATNRGGTWGSPQYVAHIGFLDRDGYKGFAVAPNGVCHLFYKDADLTHTNYDIWHMVYNNGWSAESDISNTPGSSNAPGAAVSPVDGSVVAGWFDDTQRMWDIFDVYRSPSGNWENVGVLHSGGYPDYRPEFVIDVHGRAHCIWFNRAYGSSTVLYAHNDNPSNPNGWNSPIVVKNDTREDWAFSQVDCDNDGNVYVVWVDGTTGRDQIFFRKIFPGGSMSEEVNVSNSTGTPSKPDIGVNHLTGQIGIVWEENNQVYGNAWQGGAWTGPQNLTNSNYRCGWPVISVDNGGGVYLAYQQEINGNWEIFYLTTATGPPPTTTIGSTTTALTTSTTRTTSTSSTSTTSTTTTSTSTTSTTTTTSIPVHPRPPLSPTLSTRLDGSQTRKINTLFWQRNPANDAYALKNYRVWRKRENLDDLDFSVVAAVSPGTFAYVDGNLPLDEKYTYALTTIPMDPYGQESDRSDYVSEIPVFEPLNAVVSTAINQSLFRSEKINVVSWARNPLNDAVTILQVNIFRRIQGQSDSQFKRIGSVAANVSEYRDRRLSADKFEYVVTVTTTVGFESAWSNIARE
jgi:hypothetical protein